MIFLATGKMEKQELLLKIRSAKSGGVPAMQACPVSPLAYNSSFMGAMFDYDAHCYFCY